MESILNYIKNNGNKTFKELEFNEIDNVIFSSISYSEFKEIISEKRNFMKLDDALIKFINNYSIKDAAKLGIAQKDSYKIIKELIGTKRYRDILVYNYEYVGDKDKQFCAVTFKLRNTFTYVAFEGTDHLLSGWKEDFEMIYTFPVPAQEYAIKYLNETVNIFDKNLIVGGHSKGGNLALVSSMYCHPLIRRKINKIYVNDGPGLRLKQIESLEYKRIEKKLIQIIPDYSVVGLLLRHNDDFTVIKSHRKDIIAHSVLTWCIDGNKFKREKLSNFSKKLDKSIIIWLDNHDDNTRKKMILSVFNALEEAGIRNLYDIKNIKNALNVIKQLRNIDKETKDLIYDFFIFNFSYVFSKKSKKELD